MSTVAIDESPKGHQESTQPSAMEQCNCAVITKESSRVENTAQCQQRGNVKNLIDRCESYALRKTLEQAVLPGEFGSTARPRQERPNARRRKHPDADEWKIYQRPELLHQWVARKPLVVRRVKTNVTGESTREMKDQLR